VPNIRKSGSLKLLEPSGPHRACYGTALPFTFTFLYKINKSFIAAVKHNNIFSFIYFNGFKIRKTKKNIFLCLRAATNNLFILSFIKHNGIFSIKMIFLCLHLIYTIFG